MQFIVFETNKQFTKEKHQYKMTEIELVLI